MIRYENECVGCPTEMGCLGKACPYVDVPVYVCDECESDDAEYQIDGHEYCEDCAKKYLQESFDELTISEKADLLGIDFTILE